MSLETIEILSKLGGYGIALLVLWGVYRIVSGVLEKMAKPLIERVVASWDAASKSIAAQADTMSSIRDSLIRIESKEINEAEELRFMRDAFSKLVSHMADLAQKMSVAEAINEMHRQEGDEIHSMMQDVHTATVDRPTAQKRLVDIKREHEEREAVKREVEEQMRRR